MMDPTIERTEAMIFKRSPKSMSNLKLPEKRTRDPPRKAEKKSLGFSAGSRSGQVLLHKNVGG
jgi:hypothetical protein